MNLVNNNLLNFNKKGYIMCKIDETKNKKKGIMIFRVIMIKK